MKFLIWSFEHRQWWRPNRMGYTPNIEDAGLYTAEEAGEIVVNSIFLDEIAIAEPLAMSPNSDMPMPPLYHPTRGKVEPLERWED